MEGVPNREHHLYHIPIPSWLVASWLKNSAPPGVDWWIEC